MELGNMKDDLAFWITPISEERFKSLVVKRKIFGVGPSSPGRSGMRAGDRICFYVSGKGITGDATIETSPHFEPKAISPIFPITFKLKDVNVFPETPKILDAATVNKLEASKHRNPSSRNWGLFVRTLHRVSRHDFEVLTRAFDTT
jgi:hypothetical protein